MAYDNSDPNLVGLFLDEGEEEFDVDAYDADKKRRKLMEEILAGGVEPDEELDEELLGKLDLEDKKPTLRHLKGTETEAEKEAKYGRIDEQAPGEIELQERHELFSEDPFEPNTDDESLGLSEDAEDVLGDLMKDEDGDEGDGKITVKSKQVKAKTDKNKPVKITKTEVAGEEIPEDPFEAMARKAGKKMTSMDDRPVYEDKEGVIDDERGIEEDQVTGALFDLIGGAGIGGALKAGGRGLGRLLGRLGAREAAGEGVGAAASRSPMLRTDMSRGRNLGEMRDSLFERVGRTAREAGGPDSMAIRGAETTRPGRMKLQFRDATNKGSESSSAVKRFGGFGEGNRSDVMRAVQRILDQVKKEPGKANMNSVRTQLRNLGLSDREISAILP